LRLIPGVSITDLAPTHRGLPPLIGVLMPDGGRRLFTATDVPVRQVFAAMLRPQLLFLQFVTSRLADWLDTRAEGHIDVAHFYFPTGRNDEAWVDTGALDTLPRPPAWLWMRSVPDARRVRARFVIRTAQDIAQAPAQTPSTVLPEMPPGPAFAITGGSAPPHTELFLITDDDTADVFNSYVAPAADALTGNPMPPPPASSAASPPPSPPARRAAAVAGRAQHRSPEADAPAAKKRKGAPRGRTACGVCSSMRRRCPHYGGGARCLHADSAGEGGAGPSGSTHNQPAPSPPEPVAGARGKAPAAQRVASRTTPDRPPASAFQAAADTFRAAAAASAEAAVALLTAAQADYTTVLDALHVQRTLLEDIRAMAAARPEPANPALPIEVSSEHRDSEYGDEDGDVDRPASPAPPSPPALISRKDAARLRRTYPRINSAVVRKMTAETAARYAAQLESLDDAVVALVNVQLLDLDAAALTDNRIAATVRAAKADARAEAARAAAEHETAERAAAADAAAERIAARRAAKAERAAAAAAARAAAEPAGHGAGDAEPAAPRPRPPRRTRAGNLAAFTDMLDTSTAARAQEFFDSAAGRGLTSRRAISAFVRTAPPPPPSPPPAPADDPQAPGSPTAAPTNDAVAPTADGSAGTADASEGNSPSSAARAAAAADTAGAPHPAARSEQPVPGDTAAQTPGAAPPEGSPDSSPPPSPPPPRRG
ncbi:MAG: hypothetical protein V2J16_13015, partial [Thermoleophilia bacterium]|nr:hypothetical protein [Thermoleophilia bacterium]